MTSSRISRALVFLLACFAISTAGSGLAAASLAPTVPAGTAETETDPVTRQGPVVLKVADRSVNFGGRFRLRGKTGNPYPGAVRVQSRSRSGWRTLRKVRTGSDGRFSTSVRARTSTRLRILTNDGRRSETRKVVVIGHIKLARNERFVRIGNSLLIRGTVVPRGVRTLRIRVRGGGVITTRSRANGRFRVRWIPRSAGDFSFRVFAARTGRSTGDSTLRRRFSALRPGHASYYGPGLYGNGVACGGTLTPTTRGVAHKYLPCGTKVTLQYGNRTVVARVIDRGPYIAGRDWDLTEQTRNDLGFGGVGVVWTNK
ncbi:MAG: hypothetical protein KDB57_03780 [Solirubrobacterales bacterium]|nr:hypothetical protein [Solirubrobacterales bacterium]